MLAEDAIKAALKDYKLKREQAAANWYLIEPRHNTSTCHIYLSIDILVNQQLSFSLSDQTDLAVMKNCKITTDLYLFYSLPVLTEMSSEQNFLFAEKISEQRCRWGWLTLGRTPSWPGRWVCWGTMRLQGTKSNIGLIINSRVPAIISCISSLITI